MSTEPGEVLPREWASSPVEYIIGSLIALLLGLALGGAYIHLQQTAQIRKATDRTQQAEESLQQDRPKLQELQAYLTSEEEFLKRINSDQLDAERRLERMRARVAEAEAELRRLRGEKDAAAPPAPAPH